MTEKKSYRTKTIYALVVLVTAFCVGSMGDPAFSVAAQRRRLPDLIVNEGALRASLEFSAEQFSPSDCAIVEGCVSGTGTRKLLRFTVGTPNIGTADLIMGDPEANPDLYEYSPCHGHYHFIGYSEYVLMSRGRATPIVVGRKQAFCLLDSAPYAAGARPSSGYTCDYQGITVGWQDIYYSNLDCQWLDITDVPPGNYLLTVEVNPERKIVERNYRNNAAAVPVTIP
jgi:hypothetical protein